MAKKKSFYAVKIGKAPGIYQTWSDCESQIKGISGAVYQGFATLEEAERYLGNIEDDRTPIAPTPITTASNDDFDVQSFNLQVEQKINDLMPDGAIAFVDGSYDVSDEKSAFGAIIFSHGGNIDKLYKAFTKDLGEEFISLRNVAAELEGVKEAINWAILYNKSKISIYYDYAGIEKWANGKWKAKNTITQNYVQFIQDSQKRIKIEFVKVPAHTGITHNEEVDELAKSALLAKGHKTYNDGSVYFVGYGIEDWEAIIQCINDENSSLADVEQIAPLVMTTEHIGTRDKIKISQSRNTVSINCYRNSKSYVQGKQTVLFQKIIAAAIELMGNSQNVVETLNNYHALTLTSTEVENRFEQLLPHYRHESDKHYSNLLSAVYNIMLTGYMPDYTCLVTPIFRAYEYYLHRILGDVMGLDTETDTGKNVFSFFSKNSVGKYECNRHEKSVLTSNQLDYLNTLYTTYNSVRHPYSHWSASDIDTAVITDMEAARQILSDGLNLVDQYYRLF